MGTVRGLTISLLVTALVLNTAPTYSAPFDAEAAAQITNSRIREYAGDKTSINDNLAKPLTTDAPMTTFEGRQFNATMTCKSSKKFLELLSQPTSTGDLRLVSLTQDTNLDGTTDASYSLPQLISGVCANGIISCDPGTYNGCQAYKWAAAADATLSLNTADMTEMGGCYCINNYCGSSIAMDNLSIILGDLGSGAAAALATVNPVFALTAPEINGPLATYFAQEASSCTTATAPVTVTSYYPSATSLATDGTTATTIPGSTYELITTSVAASSTSVTRKSCQKTRAIDLAPEMIPVPTCVEGTAASPTYVATAGIPTGSWNTSGSDAWVFMGAVCKLDAPLELRVQISDGGGIGPGLPPYCVDGEGWFTISAPSSGAFEGLYWAYPSLSSGTCQTTPIKYSGSCFAAGGCNVDLELWEASQVYPSLAACEASATGWPPSAPCYTLPDGQAVEAWLHATRNLSFSVPHTNYAPDYDNCHVSAETILSTCSSYETDTACRLQEREVDGVRTHTNYNPTGLMPLPSTVVVSNNGCTVPLNREYWVDDRAYMCTSASGFSLDDTMKRVAHIQATATSAGYEDFKPDSVTGLWATSTASMTMPVVSETPTCTNACKTHKTHAATDVASSGVTQDFTTSPTTNDIYYHECGADMVCPLGPDEVADSACACIDQFKDTLAMVQLIRLSGRDLICSTGIEAPLPPPPNPAGVPADYVPP